MTSSAVFFAMPQEGHFQNLRPLISGLAAQGMTVHVLTDRSFRSHVERDGGTFVDLFGTYPLEGADAESLPFPCRFVTYAGVYGDRILRDLERIDPSVIVYDEHAVIGRVAGISMGVPYVSVAPAHNVSPGRLRPLLASLPRIQISASCTREVATLRDRYGVHDASPFSFASGLSPFLNVYGEPPAFLTEAERRAFEPLAFHGCLPSIEEIEADGPAVDSPYFGGDPTKLKLYVSFGTVVWRYWPAEALAAVVAISESVARMNDVSAVISLGGAEAGAEAARGLAKPNVSVTDYVDQWQILKEADAFVTHNGLRSTHEAIFNRVPMISYPFFWDQPALADRCRSFGLAIPLTRSPRDPVRDGNIAAALAELRDDRESIRARLVEAREWEARVIANRDSVLQRIRDMISD